MDVLAKFETFYLIENALYIFLKQKVYITRFLFENKGDKLYNLELLHFDIIVFTSTSLNFILYQKIYF